jgi:hypothetical protein
MKAEQATSAAEEGVSDCPTLDKLLASSGDVLRAGDVRDRRRVYGCPRSRRNIVDGKEEDLKPEDIELSESLEGFEGWDKRIHAPDHQEVNAAFVSLRAGGVLGVNKAADQMFGKPPGR